MSLVRRGIQLRRAPAFSPGVASKARAEGHIYFYLDREDGGAPVPMRVDQVALDLYRGPGGRTRQVMRGLRRKELLPIRNFRYYIDRLTAIHNAFGDWIVIGEGRDVSNVPHPLGLQGPDVYHYRIADSIRVSLPGQAERIRVYEVRVRPRRDDQPGFAGSVFLEAATAAIVRMVFTFTPASYVDPRVDRVTVELEHVLWEGGLWLPYRQEVHVRREIPELDLPVASVIRAKLEVTDYEMDAVFDSALFAGPAVTPVPYGTADSLEFRSGLMEWMADEGLSPVSAASLKSEARTTARERLASGLPAFRLYTDSFSSLLRANRAEGVYAGLGASFAGSDAITLEGLTGYAFARGRASGTVRGRWASADGSVTAAVALYGGQLRDSRRPRAGASGLVNTLSTLLMDRDYSDPYFASGIRLSWARGGARSDLRLDASWERFAGAKETWRAGAGAGAVLQPLRPVEEGDLAGLTGGYARHWGGLGGWGTTASLEATAGRWNGGGNLALTAKLEGTTASDDLSRRASLMVESGRAWGTLPHQLLYYLGGRGTLPGHPFRRQGGRQFLLTRTEAAFEIVPAWFILRLLAGGGVVTQTPEPTRKAWGLDRAGSWRGYAGAGLSTLHGLIRLEGAWGFPDGAFELMLSADPRWRQYL